VHAQMRIGAAFVLRPPELAVSATKVRVLIHRQALSMPGARRLRPPIRQPENASPATRLRPAGLRSL
jgi:hypothetical protein